MKLLVHDIIALAIQLAIDEIEDTYDQLNRRDECIVKPEGAEIIEEGD